MIIKICRNSQRPLTGIAATHAQRKATLPTKEGHSFSFSSDQRSDNTLLTGGGRHAIVFRRRIGSPFH